MCEIQPTEKLTLSSIIIGIIGIMLTINTLNKY